ncbi:hypothetical protein BOX15_Mlig025887g3, partial [Macrostomum lignano]
SQQSAARTVDPDVAAATASFQAYLVRTHASDLRDILADSGPPDSHRSVRLHGHSLNDSMPDLLATLLLSPLRLLPAMDAALSAACRQLMSEAADELKADWTIKTNVHARLIDLPRIPEYHRSRIPTSADVGRYICFVGTVVRRTENKLVEHERRFECARCRRRFAVPAEFERHFAIEPPKRCPLADCGSLSVRQCEEETPRCSNYQEMRVQEQPQRLPVGAVPRSVLVCLEHDLVDACQPGEDVQLFGVVLRRWQTLLPGQPAECDLVLRCCALEESLGAQRSCQLVTNERRKEFHDYWASAGDQPLLARDRILAGICPQLCGLRLAKLAVALTLAGGVQKSTESGHRTRGQPHLLLIGDPGTGKSQFLRFASRLASRSVLTTGVGSSAAGLTAAAVREGGQWALEAGALVLADGGVCCIDEFNSVGERDRTCIHEAMEQQTLSVAKAGLVCKLNTRCSVLAATNPHGKLDTGQSLSVNTNLASPLLSRFDLVLVMLDRGDPAWDAAVSEHVLKALIERDDPEDSEDSNDLPVNDKENAPTLAPAASEPQQQQRRQPVWNLERLQAYFAYARSINPTIGAEAGAVLTAYYQRQRAATTPDQLGADRSAARTTTRLLESCIRLAEAHARLMLRPTVSLLDALMAVSVVEASMVGAALVPGNGRGGGVGIGPLASFPEQPDAEFAQEARQLLAALGLHRLLASAVDGEVGTMIGDAIDAASVINLSPPGGRPVLALSRQEFRAGEKSRLASSASSASPAKRRRTIVDDVDNNDEDNDKQKWENAKSSLAVDNVANTLVQSISSASSAALQFDIQTDWFQAGQNSDGVSNPPATSVPATSGRATSGPSTSGLGTSGSKASNAFCPIFSIDDFDIPDVIDNLETPKEAVSGKTAAVVAMDTNQTQPENSGRLSGAPMLPPPPPAAAITNSQQPSQRFAFKRLSAVPTTSSSTASAGGGGSGLSSRPLAQGTMAKLRAFECSQDPRKTAPKSAPKSAPESAPKSALDAPAEASAAELFSIDELLNESDFDL